MFSFHQRFIILFLFICGLCSSPSWSQRDTMPVAESLTAISQKYFVKDPEINPFFEIGPNWVKMYASVEDRSKGLHEIQLQYGEEFARMNQLGFLPLDSALFHYRSKDSLGGFVLEDSFPSAPTLVRNLFPSDSILTLKGWRIALDPGHIAGDMNTAILERKFIRMRAEDHPKSEYDIGFNEANLALATAWYLKDKLEMMGAEVLLTREEPNQTGMDCTWKEWRTQKFDSALAWNLERGIFTPQEVAKWKAEKNETRIYYGVFNALDLRARAEKINTFRPHLTLMIHYNVHESNEPDKDFYHKPIEENFNMAFIPGSFMKGELDEPEDRFHFLYWLTSPNLSLSQEFSKKVVEEMEDFTGIPTMIWDDSLRYLANASIRTPAKGVFARNLALTRMIHSVMCFGETFYQDNVNESMRLNEKNFPIHGIMAPKRVTDVADGYFSAIMNFTAGYLPR